MLRLSWIAMQSNQKQTKQNKTKQNKTILSLLLVDCGMRRKCRIGQCRTGECIFSWDSLTDRIRRAWDLLLMSLPIKSNRYVHSSNYAYKIVSLLLARLGLLRTWVIFSYYAYYAHYSYTRSMNNNFKLWLQLVCIRVVLKYSCKVGMGVYLHEHRQSRGRSWSSSGCRMESGEWRVEGIPGTQDQPSTEQRKNHDNDVRTLTRVYYLLHFQYFYFHRH